MAIHIYNNKDINIDGHVPIRYTCGALLLPMPMLSFCLWFRPLTFRILNGAVILDFYRAKVVTAGNTENTGTLLAENFS